MAALGASQAPARGPQGAALWSTKRTAHFERWLFWARELYLEKKLLLNHIRDEDMMADSLSKVTDRAKFLKCRAALLNLNHG